MPTGISLHIGLNAVDPGHYGGWAGELVACEADANDMTAIAKARGFTATTLLTKKGTRANVLAAIRKAAKALKSGDAFLLTYSGHGGQLPDKNGDEEDGLDETYCLYDGELVDDETYAALSQFAAGVRILVLADSCHSGSSVREARLTAAAETPAVRYRAMPMAVAQRTYRANQKFYDKILADKKIAEAAAGIKAPVILVSGCQDNQLSQDGAFNGAFTAALLQVWNDGKFKGNFRRFHKLILAKMPADQSPNLFTMGPVADFLKETPFTL